ncbi:MAG: radical SAM protein [Elusimicrobia bacterium]|nr:radical SAM protein [Elusimicrobiota bacterium]
MKVFISSFGCRVNQYEGERVREGFIRGGAQFVPGYEDADLCVVNTCSVTDHADADARLLLRRIRRANPAARLVITGCYADRAPAELQGLFPDALIVSNREKDSIPALAGCSMGLGGVQENTISSFYGHSRAYIKVQDGCHMKCSYCIIPSTRPVMRSRSPDEILGEISSLLAGGYREFVLCGIRLGRYWAQEGSRFRVPGFEYSDKAEKEKLSVLGTRNAELGTIDSKWVDLIGLIERIAALDGDFRIRLSSIEISDLTDHFLEVYARIPKTVPYFHVPLQSGSDAVLTAMKRWYTTDFYRRRLAAVRRVMGPDVAIFTDYMVGFPTETSAQFEESLVFAEEMNFAGMHIFRYSSRRGTEAAAINPVYQRGELVRRLREARSKDVLWRELYASRFLGRILPVIRETQGAGQWTGRAENFLKVKGVGEISQGWQTVTIARSQGELLRTDAV